MKQADDSLEQLLERYAFTVANCCIGSAGPTTQTDLVDLCRAVGQSVGTAAPAETSAEPREWETVLQEPVNWRSVHQQWRAGIIQERIRWHEEYMARLKTIVDTTNQRLEAVLVSRLSTHHQARLVAYYQQTLSTYRRQLAKARDSYDYIVAALPQQGQPG